VKKGFRYRPVGSLCVICARQPARVHAKHGMAGLYCSDSCKTVGVGRHTERRLADLANELRAMFGLPTPGSPKLTVPELRAIITRCQRVFPPGGLVRYPAHGARKRFPKSSHQSKRTS
jgi:hypothetical protein